MFEIQLKDGKKSQDLILMLGLNEKIDQFTVANSVHWCGYVLSSEDNHIIRKAFA